MSTSENNATPPLTRRQLREIRNTGATPIIRTPPIEAEAAPLSPAEPAAPAPEEQVPTPSDEAPAAPAPSADVTASEPTPSEPTPSEPTPAASPTGPHAADAFHAGYADSGAQYGTTGLTRRQARAQEKIRTASVPVISPDLAPAAPSGLSDDSDTSSDLPAIFRPAAAEEKPAADPEPPVSSTVNPDLGSDLLNGETPDISLPPSFDQLIARSGAATGAVSTPNALILSETPVGGPLVAPVTATGEVMITGTFELPAGLGSVGHAPGTTDGREADAVLLDGELPAASSPTPIAASAAISTVKQPGDIIRPPAPEKGSKLVIGLIITTGALAIAVAVALAIAVTTGVFG